MKTKLICSIHNKITLLPHFMDHYKKFGIEDFIFGIWRGKTNPVWDEIKSTYPNENMELVESYSEPLDGAKECIFWNQARKNYVEPDGWYVVVDLDEFYDFVGYNNVLDLISDMDSEEAEYNMTILMDRTTLDGSIPEEIQPDLPIWEQFPKDIHITYEIGGSIDKVVFAKQPITIRPGHHVVGSDYKKFSKRGTTYHFKWFGDLIGKELWKANHYKEKGFRFYTENLRLIERIKANQGKLF